MRVLLALVIVLPQTLVPATITVTGSGSVVADDGECSLREAITSANTDTASGSMAGECTAGGGDDIIELTVDVTLDTLDNFGLGLPRVTTPIEIRGNDFTVRRDPGAADFGIFYIDGLALGDLTLRNTTVSGGSASSGGGGGIRLEGGPSAPTLTLDSSILVGNSGGIGGAILINGATATVTDSYIARNSAGSGGGIGFLDGSLTLINSTLAENSAFKGGGIGTSGFSHSVTLIDSTLSGNSATEGGGIHNERSTLTLTNSTLSGNSATQGGGIYNAYGGSATLTNSTLARNSASSSGGGIHSYVEPSGYGTALTRLANTLLANSAGGGNCYPEGAITDNLNNLADDTTCGTIPPTLTGLDLDPTLADNGGPTMTHALLDGSSAIDNAGACVTPTDQRGAGRAGDCDSGAFEFLSCADPDLPLSGETVTGTETRTSCQNIVVGPAFTVAGGGDLTLRAGKSLELANGTAVEAGGAMALAIDGDLQIGHTVFITSTTYSGNLGGLAGADAKCNARAAAGGLSGVFKAWLSDALVVCAPVDACRSFTQSNAPYVRVDGVRIADDWTDLTDATLHAPIGVDELGGSAGASPWTAVLTDGDGNPAVRDCLGWASGSAPGDGWVGDPSATNLFWTESPDHPLCNSLQSLYCFEQ